MGLDISYGKIVKEKELNEDLEIHYDNEELIINQPFKFQLGSLKEDKAYETEMIGSFCAGSYGGYNGWRERLFSLVNDGNIQEYWDKSNDLIEKYLEINLLNESEPFFELINFSDCEGVIGPEVSNKLHIDFETYNNLAKERMDDYDYDLYQKFMKATGNNKIICFH